MSERILIDRIAVDREVRHGKPCVAGTRVTVAQVLDMLASGLTIEGIIEKNFPFLTREDILACIRYAEMLINRQEVYPYDTP